MMFKEVEGLWHEQFGGTLPTEGFSRSDVELPGHGIEFGLSKAGEIHLRGNTEGPLAKREPLWQHFSGVTCRTQRAQNAPLSMNGQNAVERTTMGDKKVPLSPTRRREARTRKNIASVLSSLRIKRALSLDALARRAQITPVRLERIECGTGALYLDDLFGLAKAFRLRPSTLMRRIADAVSPPPDTLTRQSSEGHS